MILWKFKTNYTGMDKLATNLAAVICIFLFPLSIHFMVCEAATGSVYSKTLFRKFFEDEGYNRNVRPVLSVDSVTDVHMLLYVAQVLDMDERQQTLTTNMWITYKWKDEFIHWNPEDWGNVTKLKVSSDLIWMPDIMLYNCAADNYVPYMTKKICIIESDGAVNWASPVIFKSHCNIDVTHFPFDKQSCKLKFGPWQYDGTEVNLTGTGDTSVFISDGEWDMNDLDVEQFVNFYPDAPGIPYTDIVFTMHFKRRSLYYVFNLVMPCVMVAGITVLGFVLPADSGEKVSLGITVLLSLTVFLLLIAESMPPSSDVPVIGQYYAATMLLVSLSIMLTVIVLNLHHRGPTCRPVPRWMRRIFLNKLAPLLLLTPKRKSTRKKGLADDLKIFMRMQESETSIIDMVTPLHQNYQPTGNESPIHAMQGVTTQNIRRDGPERACCHQQLNLLRRLVDHTRVVRDHYDNLDRSESMRGEWKQVAQVVDRLFMIFYLLGTLSTLLIIFIQLT